MNNVSEIRADSEYNSVQEEAETWLVEAIALIDAINLGELLSAMPESEEECGRHQTGVNLIGILEKQLRDRLHGIRLAIKH